MEIESRDKGYRCTYLFEGNSWLWKRNGR